MHNPLCARCGDAGTVLDHIEPHGGALRLFWSRSNWQTLCKSCHDQKTLPEIHARRDLTGGLTTGYALRNTATPMGISEFRHLETLPEQLKGTLPTIEEIEAELGKPEGESAQ